MGPEPSPSTDPRGVRFHKSDVPPLVSVVIPAYNAAPTIRRAIDSVLSQDYAPFEVIVVDDKSTDDTLDVLSSYDDARLRILGAEENQGATKTRNRAIDAAFGRYVAFLDADDEWLPGKLSAQIRAMEANPSWVMSACKVERLMPDGTRRYSGADGELPVSGPEAWRTLLAYTFVNLPTVVVRTQRIRKLGGFDPDLPVAEDQDMWIRLAISGAIGYLDDCLVRVHVVPGSLMHRHPRGELDYLLPMIERHIASQRHRLSDREIRAIRAKRWARIGRNLYDNGFIREGGLLVLRSAAYGADAIDGMLYLLRSSPPVRYLKKALGRGPRA